eukprot:3987090-Pyramimonas_sp.AAC.1
MLSRTPASQFGATDAVAVALTAGHSPVGSSMRVADLGGRGIMATPTTVDTIMIVTMMVAMVAMATARPM